MPRQGAGGKLDDGDRGLTLRRTGPDGIPTAAEWVCLIDSSRR